MFYTIYKTTNKINGKIYIGQHVTNRLDDGYVGSGKKLKDAIKKYGKENFKKDILFIFDNFEEMNLKEREIVNEEFIKSKENYNLVVGGNDDKAGKILVTFKNNDESFYIFKSEFDENIHCKKQSRIIKVFSKVTNQPIYIESSEYNKNKDLYFTTHSNKTFVIDKLTGSSGYIDNLKYRENKHLYKTQSTGKISVRNKLTGETLSISKDNYDKELYEPVLGGCVVEENGVRKYVSKKEFAEKGMSGIYKGRVTVKNKETGITQHLPREEYDKCPDKWEFQTVGRLTAINKLTNKKEFITMEQFNNNRDLYLGGNTFGQRTVVDRETMTYKNIPKESFDDNLHINAMSTKFIWFNPDGSIKLEYFGLKKDFIETYKIPERFWQCILKEKVFYSKYEPVNQYNGCYFKLIDWKADVKKKGK